MTTTAAFAKQQSMLSQDIAVRASANSYIQNLDTLIQKEMRRELLNPSFRVVIPDCNDNVQKVIMEHFKSAGYTITDYEYDGDTTYYIYWGP